VTKEQRAMISEIRSLAKTRGLEVRVNEARGKGSHMRIYIGERAATVPAKIKTGTRRAILKQLGLN
jgi:mRNA interferase HicA